MIKSFLSLSLMCSMVSLQANQMSAKTYLYLTCRLWVRAVRLSLTTSFTSTSAFLRLWVGVFDGFLDGVEEQRDIPLLGDIEHRDQINPFNTPSHGVIKMISDQIILISIWFMYYRVVDYYYSISSVSTCRTKGLICFHNSLLSGSWSERKRVILSWLTDPSRAADNPVAVV
jgi:hypothetical protein